MIIVMARGFTLIETIMILSILSVIAAFVVMRWDLNPTKLDAATRKVAADLRFAQQLAVTTQQRSGITMNGATRYTVFRNGNPADPAPSAGAPCSSDGAGNFVVDFSAPQCSSFSGVSFTAMPTVYFSALGAPVDASGVPLAGNQFVDLLLGATRRITIEAGTGRISY